MKEFQGQCAVTGRKPLFYSGLCFSLLPSDSSFRSKKRERNGKDQGEEVTYSSNSTGNEREATWEEAWRGVN